MIERGYVVGVIVAMGLVTFALRALPFVATQWLEKNPVVQKLGQFLPLAIMTLLLVHSAVGAAKEHATGPWPELLAVAVVVLVQWRSRNALLSILVGTGIYVLMRNFSYFAALRF
jgi:branched-subunit amino acid transport protein AzlD